MPAPDLLTVRPSARPRPALRERPALRRLLSALLAAVAVAGTGWVALGHRAADGVAVLVATGQVPVGDVLSGTDVEVRHLPPRAVPQGALARPDEAVGLPAAAVLARGEVLTAHDVRTGSLLIGRDAAEVAVWLPLLEPQVVAGLTAGDLVDVLSPVDGTVVLTSVPVLAVPVRGGPVTGLAAVAGGGAGGQAAAGGVWLAVPTEGAGALAAARGADPAGAGLLVAVRPPAPSG
ncbi:SAF domain-containing protein [Ornithinimicrobium avium]|uniref:SAF domain-containing protein n=1 Tax=Ornithinimicrobium avium TaxID=2283195 RepID=A0A345NQE9_9MICO|nr:SAF domain-containing protein [Ornithinimicrobium avium]AXH97257.1 hypothetical protein DV701_15065 [Ornithinimicrobium avium]